MTKYHEYEYYDVCIERGGCIDEYPVCIVVNTHPWQIIVISLFSIILAKFVWTFLNTRNDNRRTPKLHNFDTSIKTSFSDSEHVGLRVALRHTWDARGPSPANGKRKFLVSSTFRRANSFLGHLGHHTSVRALPRFAEPPLKGTHPKYPIENIVFQGGGAKGIIYCGCIQALGELGILPYLKRFAGASAGCAAALFLSLGLNAKQANEEADQLDFPKYFDCGKNPFTLGYNAIKSLGMHKAEMVEIHFGKVLEKYTGNPDLTFLQLYQQFGRELCIAVSNVSRQQMEYCHVVTTPDMPIRKAMRASMSLPFFWKPVELYPGELYVDGGLFNNFPIKAFDGWFLSTDKEDGLLAKIAQRNPKLLRQTDLDRSEVVQSCKEALFTSFIEPNMATIGFRVSNEDAPDEVSYASYLENLEKSLRTMENGLHLDSKEKMAHVQEKTSNDIPFPDTKLSRAFMEKAQERHLVVGSSEAISMQAAYVEMFSWLISHSESLSAFPTEHPHGIDCEVLIDKLEQKPPKKSFSPGIFGLKSWRELTETVANGNEYITRTDISRFWDKFGVRNAYMKNRKPASIVSLTGLAGELLNSMYNVAEEQLLRDPNNAKRICSLNTKYIGLMDIELEQADREFAYKIGKRDTIEWLENRSKASLDQRGLTSRAA